MRDEGLLKLFFAGVLGREECIAVVEAKREFHAEKLAGATRDRAGCEGERAAGPAMPSCATGSG